MKQQMTKREGEDSPYSTLSTGSDLHADSPQVSFIILAVGSHYFLWLPSQLNTEQHHYPLVSTKLYSSMCVNNLLRVVIGHSVEWLQTGLTIP